MTSEYWERFAKRRVSRRKVLAAGAAGSAAVALGMIGCGGGGGNNKQSAGNTPSGGPTATPKTGGIFRQGSIQTALSIDPHTEAALGLAFIPYIYSYLMHQIQVPDNPPQMVWDLAESMENPDDLTYIFKMRQGVNYQNLPPVNGRAVSADDVVYSFDRITSVSPEPLWTTYVDTKTAPDASTFKLTLKKPYAYTIEDLGAPKAAIVPREAVDQFGDLKTKGIGSGPFIVDSFTSGDRIEMSRNPNYYVSGIPYVDGIEYRSIADESALRVAFRGKQFDVYTPPTKTQADEVVGYGSDVNLVKELGLLTYKIQMNELSRPEFGDERIREAIDLSIDRDQLIQKLAFGEGEYTGPVSPAVTFWSLPLDELHQRMKRDVAKAKQLLEQAGASNLTVELKFPTNTSTDICVLLKAQLEEAGITVNLAGEEFGTWFADRTARNFQLSVGGGLPYGTEKYPIQFMYITDWTRDSIPIREPLPDIDPEIDQVMATPDINERQKLVLDVTRKMLDRHGPFFYLYVPYSYTARWSYVHGYENVPSAKWLYVYDMWLDK
jgi:peptide/nickel transport system substrate-binding protein